ALAPERLELRLERVLAALRAAELRDPLGHAPAVDLREVDVVRAREALRLREVREDRELARSIVEERRVEVEGHDRRRLGAQQHRLAGTAKDLLEDECLQLRL